MRLCDMYYEILVGVEPPIDSQLRVSGEMCQVCLDHKIQTLLNRGRQLNNTPYPNLPEVLV